jgi:hypothetical protein
MAIKSRIILAVREKCIQIVVAGPRMEETTRTIYSTCEDNIKKIECENVDWTYLV